MGAFAGPNIVENGLIFALEPSSSRSYSGVGTEIDNVKSSAAPSNLYDHTFVSSGTSSYFICSSPSSFISNSPITVDPASGNGFTICMVVNPQASSGSDWNYWFNQDRSDGSKMVQFGTIGTSMVGWEMKDHVQPYGEKIFTTVGTTQWTVPVGVTSITAVCIGGGGGGSKGGGIVIGGQSNAGQFAQGGGGGGLRYSTNISVTPGETLTITVGAGGAPGFSANFVGSGGGPGGTSSIVRTSNSTTLLFATGGTDVSGGQGSTISGNIGGANGGIVGVPGGSGAAGYSGNGGSSNGGTSIDGGWGGTSSIPLGQGGGGVGLYGAGDSALASGGGGSGGSGASGSAGLGGSYGGGGGGARGNTSQWNGISHNVQVIAPVAGAGAQGAVRIVWGINKSYPSTGIATTSRIQTQSASFSGWTFLVCGVTTTYRTFYSTNGGVKNLGTSSDWADSEVISFDNIFGTGSSAYSCSWGNCLIYNRELTTDEITQNYNNFKIRYGI